MNRSAFVLICGLPILGWAADLFRITETQLDPSRTLRITYPSDTNHYFVLRGGSSLLAVTRAMDLVAGRVGTNSFFRSTESDAAGFFRVQRVSVLTPMDLDRDGIDDAWELRYRRPGAALNAGDPHEDHNANGRSDIQDYLQQLPPPAASFVSSASQFVETARTVAINVRFERPYSGPLKFHYGGTAIEGRDYAPGFSRVPQEAFTGLVMADDGVASIPVTLLASDSIDFPRALVVSLQQMANDGNYRLGAVTTHVLSILEADRGVFGGVIVFTNGALVASQPVKIALRSDTGGGAAHFDTSAATLFQRRPFDLPVQFATSTSQFSPVGAATGTVASGGTGRSYTWRLELIQPTIAGDVLSSGVRLGLDGISASGQPIVAHGAIRANRLDQAR